MEKIPNNKKNKLKKLLLALSTDEEKVGYSALEALDRIDEVNESVKAIRPDETLREDVRELKAKIAQIKNVDMSPMHSLLGDIKDVIATSKTVPVDYAPTYKSIIAGLAEVSKTVKDKPNPVWNWPQYAGVSVRNKSFSPINPAVDGFNIGDYDDIVLGYTGANLTTVTYKFLGLVSAVLTLSYDGSGNLTEAKRTL